MGQLFSCSFSLHFSVPPFKSDSSICPAEETFWSGFQWTKVRPGLYILLVLSSKQSARETVSTVGLVGGGRMDP